MHKCEEMDHLSNLHVSAIIRNEMRKNASVFHNAFSTFFLSLDENDVENTFCC